MRGPGTEPGTERPFGGAEWVAESLRVTRRTAGRMGQILWLWASRGPWEQQRGLGKETRKERGTQQRVCTEPLPGPGPCRELVA